MGELGAHATKISVGLTGRKDCATPFAMSGGFAVTHHATSHPYETLAGRRMVQARLDRTTLSHHFFATSEQAVPARASSITTI
jgi:hypothetical protein